MHYIHAELTAYNTLIALGKEIQNDLLSKTDKTLLLPSHGRVPMNLVLMVLTLGPVSRMSRSDLSNGDSSAVFKAMSWLTGLSTLLQVATCHKVQYDTTLRLHQCGDTHCSIFMVDYSTSPEASNAY